MCRLRNIAMRDYQESVTTGQTYTQTDRQTPDKVIPMWRRTKWSLCAAMLRRRHKKAFSWLWSCLVVPLAVCSFREKPLNWVLICIFFLWQKPEFVVKAWIKHIVVAKTTIKHEVVAKASLFIAFGYEKNNPAPRAGEKITLLRYCPKKNFRSRHRSQASPPPPDYQMDRALGIIVCFI